MAGVVRGDSPKISVLLIATGVVRRTLRRTTCTRGCLRSRCRRGPTSSARSRC